MRCPFTSVSQTPPRGPGLVHERCLEGPRRRGHQGAGALARPTISVGGCAASGAGWGTRRNTRRADIVRHHGAAPSLIADGRPPCRVATRDLHRGPGNRRRHLDMAQAAGRDGKLATAQDSGDARADRHHPSRTLAGAAGARSRHPACGQWWDSASRGSGSGSPGEPSTFDGELPEGARVAVDGKLSKCPIRRHNRSRGRTPQHFRQDSRISGVNQSVRVVSGQTEGIALRSSFPDRGSSAPRPALSYAPAERPRRRTRESGHHRDPRESAGGGRPRFGWSAARDRRALR